VHSLLIFSSSWNAGLPQYGLIMLMCIWALWYSHAAHTHGSDLWCLSAQRLADETQQLRHRLFLLPLPWHSCLPLVIAQPIWGNQEDESEMFEVFPNMM
jgi:hypothetical protein